MLWRIGACWAAYVFRNHGGMPSGHCALGQTRGGPCQHGFMCGCKQWSNDINESNNNNGRNGSFFVAGYIIEERRR